MYSSFRRELNLLKDVPSFLVFFLCLTSSLFFVACSNPEPTVVAPDETDAVSTVPVDEQPATSLLVAPELESAGSVQDQQDQDGLNISFCGLKGTGDSQMFKIFDWDQNDDSWVQIGDDYRSYKIVGIEASKGVENLVIEKGEFWFLYPLEDLKSKSVPDQDKVDILLAKDVPEGVNIMDYIEAHTKPLNSGEMPDDLPVLNPDVDMDAIN